MQGVKKSAFGLITVFIFLIIISFSFAEDSDTQSKSGGFKEFGVFSGWATGKLKRQDDLEMIPLYLQFGFDMKPLLSKINLNPKGDVNFILEPLLNTVVAPDSNVELGCNFMVKYSFPIIKKLHFYLEGGLGLLYGTLHTYEQSTQFNFSEQLGGGIKFYFSENTAINAGYRYRHFSNAGIEEPNGGIDADYILCGITISY